MTILRYTSTHWGFRHRIIDSLRQHIRPSYLKCLARYSGRNESGWNLVIISFGPSIFNVPNANLSTLPFYIHTKAQQIPLNGVIIASTLGLLKMQRKGFPSQCHRSPPSLCQGAIKLDSLDLHVIIRLSRTARDISRKEKQPHLSDIRKRRARFMKLSVFISLFHSFQFKIFEKYKNLRRC